MLWAWWAIAHRSDRGLDEGWGWVRLFGNSSAPGEMCR
jgi:hypothetical protein